MEQTSHGAAPVRRAPVSPRTGLPRFVWRVVLFFAIQAAIAAAVLRPFVKQAPETYMAELNDKHARLVSAPSPRLILVGSSNLAFSIDSMLLRDQLQVEPVNLGIHQGLGFPWLLNVTARNVREGDVVLFAMEYLHFQYDGTTDTLPEALMAAPRATLDGMDFEVFQKTADQALALLGRRIRTLGLVAAGRAPFRPQTPYRQDSFNEYGDVVAHRTMPHDPAERRRGSELKFDHRRFDYAVARLNEMIEQCRARGATVYFSYAPYPTTEYARDKDVIAQLHAALERELDCPIITQPHETVYPDEEFFDMEYHLMAPATAQRTGLIVERLQDRARSASSR